MEVLYTFWEFLNDNTVVIPIIQRDYAQGRKEKKSLRINFLTQLKEALTVPKQTILDFVYGAVENGKLYPLDGQQRLTTLWLLYWYFAFQSGALNDNPIAKERLLKFSYQTRPSSKDFCRELCSLTPLPEGNGLSLEQHITNQRWFLSSFYQDPTISAMLAMLSSNDDDSIDYLFSDLVPFDKYWNILTGPDCPIRFYHKSMQDEDLPLTDDLYIKMNARGKRLTEFENFKAELFEYKNREEQKLFDIEADSESFISRFENEWTNIFWNGHRHNVLNRIDEIYLKFLNRFILNYFIAHADKALGLDEDPLFKHIYEGEEFSEIKVYSPVLKPDFKETLRYTLDGIVTSLTFCNNNPNNLFEGKPIIIPDYLSELGEEVKVSSINPRERVLLYAACLFFEQIGRGKSFTVISWNDWIRFVDNVSRNPQVDSPQSVISAIRAISNFGSNSTRIIECLSHIDTTENRPSSQIEKQIVEECEKALYIQSIREGKIALDSSLPSENDILDAEQFRVFKGSVRFLYRDGSNSISWRSFKNKYKRSSELFGPLTNSPDNRKRISRLVLRNLVYRFSDWEQLRSIAYDSSDEEWKKILIKELLSGPIHALLTEPLLGDDELRRQNSPLDGLRGTVHKELFSTDLVEYTTWEPFLLREDYYQQYYWLAAFNAKAEWKHYYLGNAKNHVLTEAADKHIISFLPNNNHRIHSSSFCWGYTVPFEYKSYETTYFFRWEFEPIIRRGELDSEGRFIIREGSLSRDVSTVSSVEGLKQVLDDIINESKELKSN